MRTMLSIAAALTFTAGLVSRAEAVPIVVSADATVVGGLFADVNFGSEVAQGGLLSGQDGSGFFGPYRFYLAFTLPLFSPGTVISSAVLQGVYNADWDTFDDRTHSIYQVATMWSESTITWNNQPGPVGAALGTFNAAAAIPGSQLSWDVTSVVNAAYLNHDAFFSVMFRADNESVGVAPQRNNNLEYFASREFSPERSFKVDVQVSTERAVPEPTTSLLAATGLVGAIVRARLRHRFVREYPS